MGQQIDEKLTAGQMAAWAIMDDPHADIPDTLLGMHRRIAQAIIKYHKKRKGDGNG